MRTHYQKKKSGRGSRYAEDIGDTPTYKELRKACDKRLKSPSKDIPDWVRELNERNK